jgi:hypothetical protein
VIWGWTRTAVGTACAILSAPDRSPPPLWVNAFGVSRLGRSALGDFTSSTPQMNTRAQKKDGREGKTAYAIARDLNQDAVPTAQGCTRLVANYGPRAC